MGKRKASVRGKAPGEGRASSGWKPGDQLPDSPTILQLEAHTVVILKMIESRRPKKDPDSPSSKEVEEMETTYCEMMRLLEEEQANGKKKGKQGIAAEGSKGKKPKSS